MCTAPSHASSWVSARAFQELLEAGRGRVGKLRPKRSVGSPRASRWDHAPRGSDPDPAEHFARAAAGQSGGLQRGGAGRRDGVADQPRAGGVDVHVPAARVAAAGHAPAVEQRGREILLTDDG